MRTAGTWHLHHDNVQAHKTLSIEELLAKYPIPISPEPPYSPHLSFLEFSIPKIKVALEGRRFQMIEDIIRNMRVN
jgi:hypothetical protein